MHETEALILYQTNLQSGFSYQTDLSCRHRYIPSLVCTGFHFAKMSFNPLHEGQAAQQHDLMDVIRKNLLNQADPQQSAH